VAGDITILGGDCNINCHRNNLVCEIVEKERRKIKLTVDEAGVIPLVGLHRNIKFTRVWAMPNKWTFTIKPIRELLAKYNVGVGWVDPFAGENSPAELTNDINPERKAKFHLDAEDFLLMLGDTYNGILFDPPYSYRQVSEHYKAVGRKVRAIDTSTNFFNRAMNAICNRIKIGGYSISFGWNSNGFGKKGGFEIIEILLVAHGGHHNDTICLVERKIDSLFSA